MPFRPRIPLSVAALVLAGATIIPAQAASPRRAHPTADQQNAAVERLNEESLQRARQGENAPAPGRDTTSNLNRMSNQDARQGQNMNQAPMPFR